MLSAEESKKMRIEFWDTFEKFSARKRLRRRKPAKWIMNETGMSQLKLKFHFDEHVAIAGIDVETRNLDKRIDIFGKLERLTAKLEKAMGEPLIFEPDYILPTGKSISRMYLKMDNVNIYSRDDWEKVMQFLFEKMIVIEKIFIEFKDYLKYS